MTDFKSWLHEQYTNLARQYRTGLLTVAAMWKPFDDGSEDALAIAVSTLREVPIPRLPERPDLRTPENMEVYKAALKPDYDQMLKQAIHELRNIDVI